jgi:proteasome alpha subunit
MADRAEYARKGIARGRSVVVRGYTYDRDDVTARGLANVYAQTLGTIFSSVGEKPYEVELIVAEVGAAPEDDQIYRLPHDGSIVDEHGAVAVGGNSDQIGSYLDQRHRDGMTLGEALKLAVESLVRDSNGNGDREITAEQLEVAVLDRTRPQARKFKRILGNQLVRLLEAEDAPAATGSSSPTAESSGSSAESSGSGEPSGPSGETGSGDSTGSGGSEGATGSEGAGGTSE